MGMLLQVRPVIKCCNGMLLQLSINGVRFVKLEDHLKQLRRLDYFNNTEITYVKPDTQFVQESSLGAVIS